MSTPLVVNFDLNGHQYICTPHPTMEGMRFATTIIGAALGPLLLLLDAAIKSGKIKQDQEMNGEALLALLDGVDVGPLAESLRRALLDLPEEQIHALFKYTRRDGLPLAQRAVFDSVYAGNWAEFYQAAYKVIEANHFLPF